MFELPPVSSIVMPDPYRKVGPLTCYVEHPKGTLRSGKGWLNITPADYGYINGYLGADHDEMDCYISDHLSSHLVWVVDQSQINKRSRFDEHKCMLGYNSEDEALADYMAGHNYSHRIFIDITGLTMDEFVDWLETGDHYAPISKAYVSVSRAS